MKILELEMKNFGKFTDKKVEVRDGIHLFYGENEAGKSTMHTFIRSMLFGLERKRGRASANDTFSKYEPWENPNYYSGTMIFECGGKRFQLERNFDRYNKSAKLLCLDDGEELSVEGGDLEALLSGLQAAGYDDTLYVGQLHAGTSQELADELRNYATNYYVTGDSEINLAGAQNELLSQRRELDREEKREILDRQNKREKIEQEASYVWRDIHHLEEELQDVEEAIKYREEKEEKEAREREENKGVLDEIRPAKWRIHPVEILVMLLIIAGAFVLIPRPWNYLVSIILALVGGIYAWNRLKEGKKKTKTPPELMLEEIMPEEEKASKEKLLWEKNHILGELREKQTQYENIQEQLEEFMELQGAYKDRDRRKAAITLASNRLEELSADMQAQMTRELNQIASEIIEVITNGRYTQLMVDDKLHMSLLKDNRKIGMEQVSQGTLEQIYFALRMAVSKMLHDEDYPIILDDTFVFYDDVRLEQTLAWLTKQKNQILIFTCQKREDEILHQLKVDYTKTQL